MINIKRVIISVLLLGAITGITTPAIAYPNITEPEMIVCEDISESIMKCDRYIDRTGEFIETYYINIYTNEYTIETTPDKQKEQDPNVNY